MTYSSHPLQSTLQALTQTPRPDGAAPIIAVMSAFSQSGSSHVARELALLAASSPSHSRVGLFDLDINKQSQADYFDRPAPISQYGVLEGPFDATFGQVPFWQVSPDMVDHEGGRSAASSYCGLYMLGQTGLVLTRFDWASVKAGQSVHVANSPAYWQSARAQFSILIVDCPSSERTDIAMNVVPYADATIIVSPEHRSTDAAHGELSQIITGAGGICAGLILNAGTRAHSFAGYVS